MAENDDIAQTEDEAIRRGYQRIDASIQEKTEPQFAHRRPCGGNVQKGDWCLMTNCRPDNTLRPAPPAEPAWFATATATALIAT